MNIFRRRLAIANNNNNDNYYTKFKINSIEESYALINNAAFVTSAKLSTGEELYNPEQGSDNYAIRVKPKEGGILKVRFIFKDDIHSLKRAFENTTLISLQNDILNNKNIDNFAYTFNSCPYLIKSPKGNDNLELWERAGKPGYPKTIIGTECFKYCVNLSNYAEIPDDWK